MRLAVRSSWRLRVLSQSILWGSHLYLCVSWRWWGCRLPKTEQNYLDVGRAVSSLTLGSVCVGLILLAAALGQETAEPKWVEIRSPHFVVASDSSEEEARGVTDQFEKMRTVFQAIFPGAEVDPASPIVVLALKSKKDMEAIEPASYRAEGQIVLAGLFLRAPEKNYILLRLNAPGLHPYAAIYHEYTHLVWGRSGEWLPLWLNEGWAQFYQNTEIHENEAVIGGLAIKDIYSLRENKLLPLETLFSIDATSPYYHKEHEGSIFYAESWALTHYLKMKDRSDGTDHLGDYVKAVGQKVDPVTAATQAFGDLRQLQAELEKYVDQDTFSSYSAPVNLSADPARFDKREMTVTESDALLADVLAYNGRYGDADTLLDAVLRDDPGNVLAHETKGFMAFKHDDLPEARKWYQQAVKLNSGSYLAHYYFAVIAMRSAAPKEEDATQVEASLRDAIKIKPSFGPAYDQLAVFFGKRQKNLPEARTLSQRAVELEPGSASFRLNAGNVLMELNKTSEGVAMLESALKLASTPEEAAQIGNVLQNARQYQTAHQQIEKANRAAFGALGKTAPANPNVRLTPPRPTYMPDPQYSDKAKDAKREGVCVLQMMVDADGKPQNIKVTHPLGLGLDEEAIKALRTWRFEPARRYGKAVSYPFMVKMTFRLFGGSTQIQELSEKAKAGDAEAELALAKDFFEGRDVQKDEIRGQALLERAAKQGLPEAQFQMGERIYAHGNHPAEYVNAYVWYTRAQRAGWQASDAALKELSGKMSAEQMAEAQGRVEEGK
jgi:TonB family protein